jgi:hypothetical protein
VSTLTCNAIIKEVNAFASIAILIIQWCFVQSTILNLGQSITHTVRKNFIFRNAFLSKFFLLC